MVSSVGSLGESGVQLDAVFAAVEPALFVEVVFGVCFALPAFVGLPVVVVHRHVFLAVGRLAALDVFARRFGQVLQHWLLGVLRVCLRVELFELAHLLREPSAPLPALRARSCPGLRLSRGLAP